MERRQFLKTMAAAGAMAWLGEWQQAYAAGTADKWVGKKWKGWKKGEFQVHFIYTGVAESMFIIMPDGTTMLLDCGDHNAVGRGKLAVPVLPSPERHAGEWIARYVERVNPQKTKVDYIQLSHYHNDHSGCETFYSRKVQRGGEDYFLSGFSEAAETLSFGKAFDRSWPDYDDPVPVDVNADEGSLKHMKKFYDYMVRERGMQVEKFRLGAVNQIAMLRNAAKYPDFSIRNVAANGRIAMPDGSIWSQYADYLRQNPPKHLNENGMSLGMIFQYGPFRFYTAGDLGGAFREGDGTIVAVEDKMGEACGHCQVAKINHHGHHSMTPKLVAALKSRVYISCVWDQLHTLPDTMERITDPRNYVGERIVCPGVFPVERRQQDAGSPWLGNIAEASYDGGHIVLNVEKGGTEYSISYLTAADESMTVKSVMRFKS